MKNKQHIMILFEMIEFCRPYIPSGMYRSVEQANADQNLHPVRDASLTGCKGEGVMAFSTERCIPTEYSSIGWRHHSEEHVSDTTSLRLRGTKQEAIRSRPVIARSVATKQSINESKKEFNVDIK